METNDAHGNLFHSKGNRFHVFHEEARLEAREERQGVDVGHRFGYLDTVLLVGQICWEAPAGENDDVADHPSEGYKPPTLRRANSYPRVRKAEVLNISDATIFET